MKKQTRALSLILAGLILTSGLISCGKEEEKEKVPVDVNIETEDEYQLEVPEGVAEGQTFSIYIAHSSVNNNYIREEETGEDLNDSIYQRNALTEQHTGVELNFVGSTRPTDGGSQQAETSQVRTLIQAGDTT